MVDYSNGSNKLRLALTIAEISDIVYRLQELHILINVIIIGGEFWKIRFIWTIHIQCMNWRQREREREREKEREREIANISIVCWEIFS